MHASPRAWRTALNTLILPLAVAGLMLGAAPAQAGQDLRLAGVLGEHMVLQRDQPIRIWGWAAPGAPVEVAFRAHRRQARAGTDGRWSVQLPAVAAGGPYALTVRSADQAVELRDVLVGEVWLCSGQSNMELALKDTRDAERVIAGADEPAIRHIKVPHHASLAPQDDILPATWQSARPEAVGQFSAAAYYFARQLQRELGVPVGLVNSSWGGSHIETWTSAEVIQGEPDLAPIVRAAPRSQAEFAERYRARMTAIARRWQPAALTSPAAAQRWAEASWDDQDWQTLQVPGVWEQQGLAEFDGVLWFRRTVELSAAQVAGAATLELGAIDDCDETYVNGQPVGGVCQWDALRRYPLAAGLLKPGRNSIAVRVTDTGGGGGFHGDAAALRLLTADGALSLAGAWRARVESVLEKTEPGMNDLPSLLFNGMVQPLTPLAVRGVLWYQGESNVTRAARYTAAMRRMIGDWRQRWARAGGPREWPFFYVQLASFLPLSQNSLAGSDWAELREAQRQALAVPGTGMVVTTDIGDATDIHPRNKEDVGLRLARLALHRVYGKAVVDSGPAYRRLTRRGPAIELRFDTAGSALAARGGSELQGFAIADASRQFKPAHAVIVGANRVKVWREDMARPLAVRYGWVNNPEQTNLVNRAGLPASPFRTDDWPQLTAEGRFPPLIDGL